MSGGGAAPVMKMSDVFLLLGVTFLVGGLFIHGLVSPTPLNADAEPYSNGASLLKGDTIEFTVTAENESVVAVEIIDEEGDVVLTKSVSLLSGDSDSIYFEADSKGFYSYTVELTEGSGEVVVDVDRKLLIDFIIYPLGIICVVFGFYKRKDEQMNESIDAVLESND
ncbi:MAG: hypothetical protein OSA21_02355 [Candidatus Poseidoniaceae archaeon]|nr:hypothetical protein [Candidatus Poseidoniaceae archaeon]